MFRTTLETELKMRVGVYEYLHSTNRMVSVVSWFERSYVTMFDSIKIRFVCYLVIISNYVFLYYFIRLKLLLYFVKESHLSVTMSVI